MSHTPWGSALTILKIFANLWKRWTFATWEAELRREEKRLNTERAGFTELLARDAQMRGSPTHGVMISVGEPFHGQWLTPEVLDVDLSLYLHNQWIYPVTMNKMTGEAGLIGWQPTEFMYADELELPALDKRLVHKRLRLQLNRQQQESLQGTNGTTREMTGKVRAYLRLESEDFVMNEQIQAMAMIPTPPNQ